MVVTHGPLAFENLYGFSSEAELSAGNGGQLLEGGINNHLVSSYALKYTIGVTLGLAVCQQLFFLQPLPGCCVMLSGTAALYFKLVLFCEFF